MFVIWLKHIKPKGKMHGSLHHDFEKIKGGRHLFFIVYRCKSVSNLFRTTLVQIAWIALALSCYWQ